MQASQGINSFKNGDNRGHPVEVPVERWWICLVGIAVLGLITLGFTSPSVALLLVALAVLGAISLIYPTVAVVAYTVLVVTNAADVATDYHGAPPIGGLLVPGMLLLLFLRRMIGLEDPTVSIYLLVPAGFYLATQSLSLLWVENPLPTIESLSDLVKNLIVVLVFCGFLTTRERLRATCFGLCTAAAGLAALSVLQYATGTLDSDYFGFATASLKNIAGQVDSWRLQGPLPDPNYYGQLLVMALPLVAAMAIAARSILFRFIGVVGAPIIVAAIVLTFSRGALAGLVGMAVFSVLLMKQRGAVILSVSLMVITLMVAAPQIVADRIAPVFGALKSALSGSQAIGDVALAQRVEVLKAGIAMVTDAPFFGIGTGQFSSQYPIYAIQNSLDLGAPSQAHNRYMEIAAEGGLLGITVFVILIGAIVIASISAIGRFRALGHNREGNIVSGLLLAILGYLTTAVFLHDDYSRVFWLLVSLVISAFAISWRTSDADGENSN